MSSASLLNPCPPRRTLRQGPGRTWDGNVAGTSKERNSPPRGSPAAPRVPSSWHGEEVTSGRGLRALRREVAFILTFYLVNNQLRTELAAERAGILSLVWIPEPLCWSQAQWLPLSSCPDLHAHAPRRPCPSPPCVSPRLPSVFPSGLPLLWAPTWSMLLSTATSHSWYCRHNRVTQNRKKSFMEGGKWTDKKRSRQTKKPR